MSTPFSNGFGLHSSSWQDRYPSSKALRSWFSRLSQMASSTNLLNIGTRASSKRSVSTERFVELEGGKLGETDTGQSKRVV